MKVCVLYYVPSEEGFISGGIHYLYGAYALDLYIQCVFVERPEGGVDAARFGRR